MSERQTLSILFYPRLDKSTGNEQEKGTSKDVVPIYLRITKNGKRAEMSIHRWIEPDKWSNGLPKGTRNETKQLKEYLDLLRSSVYQAQKSLLENHKPVTALAIRNIVQGTSEKQYTLLEVFKYHNEMMKAQVPNEYAPTTLTRFETTKKHIEDFIKYKYKTDDLFISQLNHEFVSNLEYYFKTVKSCNHNTTIKYIKNLKKIVNMAIKNDWLIKDPFANFSSTTKPVLREYLTSDELILLEEKQIATPRLSQVRDIFVFSCYTGLAYVDVLKLSNDNVVTGIDGGKWIFTQREKTSTKSNIPLLPKALEILEIYKDDPYCVYHQKLLPVISNQKMNAYLKEISMLAGIRKTLTFHLARHTFATTVTLTNGVPIESVSEMLGHKSIRTTQIYAKVIDRKVSEDMTNLKIKLEGITELLKSKAR